MLWARLSYHKFKFTSFLVDFQRNRQESIMSTASESGRLTFKVVKVDGRMHPFGVLAKLGKIPYKIEEVPVEQLQDMKDDLPFRTLPVMEFEDGRVFSETPALLHYLGQRTKLIPSDPILAMKALEICNALNRCTFMVDGSVEAYVMESDKPRAEELRQQLNDKGFGLARHAFRTLEKDPDCGPRYLVGDQLSIADITLKCMVDEWRLGTNPNNAFEQEAPNLNERWYNNIKRELEQKIGQPDPAEKK